MGESSMIVPDLAENCFLQPLHFHTRRVLMNEFLDPQCGQVGLPSGPAEADQELKGLGRGDR